MRSTYASIVRREFRILQAAVSEWQSCLLSWLVLLCGLSYLFIPLDLIPDRIPVIGHLDEAGFVVCGLLAARYLLPQAMRELRGPVLLAFPLRSTRRQQLVFAIRVLRADLGNFSLFHHRAVDGFLVTGKNSGTH